MTLHTFDPTNQSDDAAWWTTIYTRAFPDYVSHCVVTDIDRQKKGIDHVVYLTGRRELLVDVKTREKWYDDILLEVWSAKEQNSPGWLRRPLHCHYIAYATPSQGKVLMVPFQQMRLAYEKNKHAWGKLAGVANSGVREVRAKNVGYTTVSVAVPWTLFRTAIYEAMEIWLDGFEPFTEGVGE